MSGPNDPLAARPARRWAILVVAASALAGCYQEPSRWDQAQKPMRRNAPATSREALAGGEFNKFFPRPGEGYDVIYTQEKTGQAIAMLKKGGAEVATLSIFDTVSNPESADKFKDAGASLEGYPVVAVGESGTALLVGDRFQVQVRSKDANFGRADREQWLRRFDLANLDQLARRQ